jgi:uncharacterized membrane protein
MRRRRAAVVQTAAVVVAVGLGLLVPHLDVGFRIPGSRAVEMLIAVAAGTVTFIGLVFSLLFLVVQFSATTFTPRLHLFRDAPVVWRSFALYTAVVVYSFTASLVIGRSETTPGLVPIVAFTGVLASLVVYRRLQMTAFRSIQLASALSEISARAHTIFDWLYPAWEEGDRLPGAGADSAAEHEGLVVWNGRFVTVQAIDVRRVLAVAERERATVRFTVGVGETIYDGTPLASVRPAPSDRLRSAVLGAVTVGEERTFEQDPAFPLRLLSDIALRALSPAVNDPTTAIQALDAMDDLLRALVGRNLDVGEVAAADGTVRVVLSLPSWSDFLDVALDDLVALDSRSPSVSGRLSRLLQGLAASASPEKLTTIESRRRSLEVA